MNTQAKGPTSERIRNLVVRRLGLCDYQVSYDAMRRRNTARMQEDDDTPDELWLLEHPPVYTAGLKLSREHYDPIRGIPVVHSDRGGHLTYHGPGQAVIYLLLRLSNLAIGANRLVFLIEQAIIDVLAGYGLSGARRAGAPGVYIEGKKIAALGLRVRRGHCYHGLSFNVDMDLAPFWDIDPCGYEGLEVTQLTDYNVKADLEEVGQRLVEALAANLSYNALQFTQEMP